jgi:hypothetical protein
VVVVVVVVEVVVVGAISVVAVAWREKGVSSGGRFGGAATPQLHHQPPAFQARAHAEHDWRGRHGR